ncbi:MAG: hypothetical protein NT150_16160 [Bacteroidetes bacterium]|nr:hypothetical protein [Bacteroidota bacterium]
MEEKEKSSKGKLILIVLLALSLVGNAVMFFAGKSTIEAKEDKLAEVVGELDSVKVIYNEVSAESVRLKGDNEKLNGVLSERDMEVAESKKRIDEFVKTIKDKDQLIKAIRGEKDKLKKKTAEYEDRIDQLLMENKELSKKIAEKEEELNDVSFQRDHYKTKANIGAKLKAEYVQTKTYRDRVFGDGEKPTSMAKRTKKMDVCFSVLKNEIAENGAKTVFLRIVAPNGEVMGNAGKASGSFTSPETTKEVKYSSKREFTYTGAQQDVCLSYEEEADKMFPVGEYTVEIYVDKMLSSTSKYTLK